METDGSFAIPFVRNWHWPPRLQRRRLQLLRAAMEVVVASLKFLCGVRAGPEAGQAHPEECNNDLVGSFSFFPSSN